MKCDGLPIRSSGDPAIKVLNESPSSGLHALSDATYARMLSQKYSKDVMEAFNRNNKKVAFVDVDTPVHGSQVHINQMKQVNLIGQRAANNSSKGMRKPYKRVQSGATAKSHDYTKARPNLMAASQKMKEINLQSARVVRDHF